MASNQAGAEANVDAELTRALDEEQDEEVRRVLQHTLTQQAQDPTKKEVSREKLVLYLEKERQRASDCFQLPCTIAFFVVFVCTVLMHEDLTNSAQVERQFRGMITGNTFEGTGPPVSQLATSGHKDMGDIDTVPDIWTFLSESIVPMFISEDPSTLRRRSDMYRVLRYSHLIGGVQLQQIRRRRRECTAAYPNLGPKVPESDYNPVLADVSCYPYDEYDKACFGPAGNQEGFCPDSKVLNLPRRLESDPEAEEAEEPAGLASALPRMLMGLERHAAKVEGRSWQAVSGISFEGGLYTVLLHPHEGLNVALQKLQTLQDNIWIDDATSWFGVKMFLVHPDLSVYLHVIASVWLTPSGELIPGVRLTSFSAEPYQYYSRIAMDVVMLVLWFYLLVHTFMGFVKALIIQKAGAYFKNIWTWVEWLTVIGGGICLALWPVFLYMLESLKTKAVELTNERPIMESNFQFDDNAHRDRYLHRTILLHNEAAGFATFVTFYRVFVCNYTIMILMRFFKAFKAQPRLAIATDTIASSLNDLLHFMVVLLLVIVSFGAAGMLLFGHRLLGFSSFTFAASSCFLIMLGDFDFDELREEHPLMASMWFWSYFLFVSLILLNMALAIVMDVYSEVAANHADSTSIGQQIMHYVTVEWHRRDWVSLREALHKIKGLEVEVTDLTVETLSQAVPNMPPDQAIDIIENSALMVENENEKGLQMAEALCMVSWTRDAVERIGHQLESLVEAVLLRRQARQETAAAKARAEASRPKGRREPFAFDGHSKARLSALEERFERLEAIAGEAVHAAVQSSKQMRGQLASLESAICGGKASNGRPSGTPGRSPPGSPPPEMLPLSQSTRVEC